MGFNLFVVFAILCVSFSCGLGQSALSGIKQKAKAKELEESEAESFGSPPAAPYAEAINLLGVNLLREARTADGPEINLVYSPLSISAAFSLLHLGAKGSTKAELEEIFGFEVGSEITFKNNTRSVA